MQKGVAGGGDHHRVKDYVAYVRIEGESVGHGNNEFGVVEHADFYGVGSDVVDD